MPLVLGTLSMAAPPTTMTTPALCRPVPCQLAVGGDGGTANSCKALPTHHLRRKQRLQGNSVKISWKMILCTLHSTSATGRCTALAGLAAVAELSQGTTPRKTHPDPPQPQLSLLPLCPCCPDPLPTAAVCLYLSTGRSRKFPGISSTSADP